VELVAYDPGHQEIPPRRPGRFEPHLNVGLATNFVKAKAKELVAPLKRE